jgi:hypothetical protein
MGLLNEGINEVIATTAFNAAPIGIHNRNGKLTMILFHGSHTGQNIERDGWVVANLVHDPVLYVKTAFEDLPVDSFREEPVNGRKMFRLADAEGWAAFTAQVEHRTTESIVLSLALEKEIVREVALYPVNRGFNSIVDATVHATRYRLNKDPELMKLIDYHTIIVRKCGGRRELEALDLLMNFLK